MAKPETKKTEEEPPQTVGEWIVTFSDCMTLLLCFFVLLLTFSSFDQEALARFGGVFSDDSNGELIEEVSSKNDTLVRPIVHLMDHQRFGSEKPTERDDPEEDSTTAEVPKSKYQADAYRDRKIIHIPTARLFEQGSTRLSTGGRKLLRSVAQFIKRIPCRVVISETSGSVVVRGRRPWQRASLERSVRVSDFLTSLSGVSKENVCVSASPVWPGHSPGRSSVEVVLISRRVLK